MKRIALHVALAAIAVSGETTQWMCSWKLHSSTLGDVVLVNNNGAYPAEPNVEDDDNVVSKTETLEEEVATRTATKRETAVTMTPLPTSTDTATITLSDSRSPSDSVSLTSRPTSTATLFTYSSSNFTIQTTTNTLSLSTSQSDSETIHTWSRIIETFPSFGIARWASCTEGDVILSNPALGVAGCLSKCEEVTTCVYSEISVGSCRLLEGCSSWGDIVADDSKVTVKKTQISDSLPFDFTITTTNSTCISGSRSDQETLAGCAQACLSSRDCLFFSFTDSIDITDGCLISDSCKYGPSETDEITNVYKRTFPPTLTVLEQGVDATYEDAVFECVNTSRRLCTASEVCRYLQRSNSNNARWIPVADDVDQWIQVGSSCRSLSNKLIGIEDALGLNKPSPPWTDPHNEIFCCPEDDTLTTCTVPGQATADAEGIFTDVVSPEACHVQCLSDSNCTSSEYNVVTRVCKTFIDFQASSISVVPENTLISPSRCSPEVNWSCSVVVPVTPEPIPDTPVPVYINPDLVLSSFIVKLRIAFDDFDSVLFSNQVVASLSPGATIDVMNVFQEALLTAVTFSVGVSEEERLFSVQNEVVTLMKLQLPPFDRNGYEVVVLRTCYVSQPCEDTPIPAQPDRSSDSTTDLIPLIVALPVLCVIILIAGIAFKCSTSTAGKVHGKQRQKSLGGTAGRAFPEIGIKSTPRPENVNGDEQEVPSAMPLEMVPTKAKALQGPPVSSFGDRQATAELSTDNLSPRISRRISDNTATESDNGLVPQTPTKPSKKSRKASAFSKEVKEKKSKKEKHSKKEKKGKKSKVKSVQIEQEDSDG